MRMNISWGCGIIALMKYVICSLIGFVAGAVLTALVMSLTFRSVPQDESEKASDVRHKSVLAIPDVTTRHSSPGRGADSKTPPPLQPDADKETVRAYRRQVREQRREERLAREKAEAEAARLAVSPQVRELRDAYEHLRDKEESPQLRELRQALERQIEFEKRQAEPPARRKMTSERKQRNENH